MTSRREYYCKAPSNIAFIKYWGKELPSAQWPTNSSLSMTLKNCFTETSVALNDKSDEITMNGEVLRPDSSAFQKIEKKLETIRTYFSSSSYFTVKTRNSFPQGCGIASSASGMAALAAAASCALTDSLTWEDLEKSAMSRRNLSALARMMSGSACRSFWSGYVFWERSDRPDSQYSYPIESKWSLCDTILLVDQSEKSVSSSEGHLIAETSPLFRLRLEALEDKMSQCIKAIQTEDMNILGPILEEEALNMHSIMMSSEPPLKYLNKTTIELIVWLRKLRREESLPIYFTIDAGPNLHLIYEPQHKKALVDQLEKDWPHLTYIHDQTGDAPTLGPAPSPLLNPTRGVIVGSRYSGN